MATRPTEPPAWWSDFELTAIYGPTDQSFQSLIDGAEDEATQRELQLAWGVFKSCYTEKKDGRQCLEIVKLVLPQITGRVDEKAFRRSMRPFVPKLELRFGFGIGNTVVTTTVEEFGTSRHALHECDVDRLHFDGSNECWERYNQRQESSSSSDGDDDWHFDGPNTYLFSLALSGDIYHWAPNRLVRSDKDPTLFEIEETGHQIYGTLGLDVRALPFQDGSGTYSATDLAAGIGFRTDLTEVYDGKKSSVVLLPGFELFGGFSTLNASDSGGVLGVRALLPSLFFDGWAVMSFAQMDLHDFGDSSFSNNGLSLYMSGDRVTPVFGLMVSRTLLESKPDRPIRLTMPPPQTVYVPVEVPAPVAEPPPPPPPPVTIVKGMVISLADLNFYTNLPTAEQVSRFTRVQPASTAMGSSTWTLDELRQALGNQIFEPTEYNLRVLEKIAQRLNEEDIRDYAIHIVGHTDGRGSDADNDNLALQRATIVKEILVRLGVESGRLVVESRGESIPKIYEDPSLDAESLDRARSTNRRIEFLLGEKIR